LIVDDVLANDDVIATPFIAVTPIIYILFTKNLKSLILNLII